MSSATIAAGSSRAEGESIATNAAATAPVAPVENADRRTWIAVIASLLGAFMAVLDIQITNASLTSILGSLSATTEEGSWIATAYLVAEIIVIPLTGFFAGVFGKRRYILGTVSVFLIASTLCSFAWSLPSMIVFRALQGFSGGALIPMAMTLVTRLLPLRQRPMGLALFGMTATLAPTLGPTFGGMLTDLYGWPSIFLINWIPGVLLLLGVAYGLDDEPMKLPSFLKADWMGIAAMALGLGMLTITLEEGNSHDWFDSHYIITTASLSVIGLAAWIAIALGWVRRNATPFLNLRLMGRKSFFASTLIAFTTGMALYGSSFVLPLFLGQIAGYNATQIGLVILWMGLPQPFLMPIAAKLSTKVDNRILASFGLFLFAVSCLMNMHMTAQTGFDQLLAAQIVRAVGQPFIMITLTNFALHRIEAQNIASASALFNMMRNLGGSVGIAMLATLVTQREKFHSAIISSATSLYSSVTTDRIDQLTQLFISRGLDAFRANAAAVASVANGVRRDAFVLAYNDAFFLLGIALLLCIPVVWMTSRVIAGAEASAAH